MIDVIYVINVIDVIDVIDVSPVSPLRLAHLWVDFRVICCVLKISAQGLGPERG